MEKHWTIFFTRRIPFSYSSIVDAIGFRFLPFQKKANVLFYFDTAFEMPLFVSFDLSFSSLDLRLLRNLTDFKSLRVLFFYFLEGFFTENLLHFPFEWIHRYGKYDVKFTFLLACRLFPLNFALLSTLIPKRKRDGEYTMLYTMEECSGANTKIMFVEIFSSFFFPVSPFFRFLLTCVGRSFMQMQCVTCTMHWKFDNDLLSSVIQCFDPIITLRHHEFMHKLFVLYVNI